MAEPRDKSAHTTFFFKANHSGNVVTCSFHTVVLIYMLNANIIWFPKKKNIIEISMFGSEFMAMRIDIYLFVVLRYKFRMFYVLFDGPYNIMCDNQEVVNNTSLPRSPLDEKKIH